VRFTSRVDTSINTVRAGLGYKFEVAANRAIGAVDMTLFGRLSGSSQSGKTIMKIYGDINSGNCLKVKWICDKLALRYNWIGIDTLKGETRTAQFLKLNGAGQVPTVEFEDGRTLAQSNAIIRYLARGSDLIPADAFAAAKMDEWLFWEQYSHEPYIAVCRFQMVYLGKPASDLDPDKVKRGYAALDRMEHQLASSRFLVGDTITLADLSLLAYTRLAHEGGFDLQKNHAAVRRWIGEAEKSLGLQAVR
jgi:glutathione S-transferase